MISPYLEAEQHRLLLEIERIQQSGAVAPANVWISPNFQTKGDKVYEYYKLSSENSRIKHQHLGKAGSKNYCDWTARLTRRYAIQELETQVSMLRALMDRQLVFQQSCYATGFS